MPTKAGHAVGVLTGLIAAPVLFFMVLKGAEGLTRIEVFDSSPAGFPPASTSGSASAAVMLAGAAVIAGLLAGTWRLSPVAPLLAGLALAAVGLYGRFDYLGMLRLMNHLPAGSQPGFDELVRSGIWPVLGGILLVSAAWPWRWTGRLATSFRPERGALGVIVGLAAVPTLWYLIQLANPVGYVTVVSEAHLPRFDYMDLLPQLAAAAVIAALAATRWVSPVAAAIAGLPLLVIGLLLVLVPVDAAQWIAPYAWSSRPIMLGEGQSLGLGAYLLFGGLLVTSAALPWRWRPPARSAAPDAGAPAVSQVT